MRERARKVLALAALALLGGCVKKEPCHAGTILLTVTFDGPALDLASVQVTTKVAGASRSSPAVAHAANGAALAIEILLSSYQTDAVFEVAVAGDANGRHFADAKTGNLSPGCSLVSLHLGQPVDAGASEGGADAASDLACGAGTHVCGAACADDGDPATCGARCEPCPLPMNADRATCDGVTCGFKCRSGYHACGDRCAADDSPQSCGSSCTACVAPTGGTATCDGTTCGGTCPADQKLCAGVCIPVADTCAGFCSLTTHDCNGLCASNSSINTCGPSACTACPTPTNGTAVCDGASCSAKCADGYKACPDVTCVPIGGCCTAADCGDPPNGLGTCTAAHTCNLTCKSGFHLCGGQCVDNKSPDHCGASCDACPVPAAGTATCDGQSCGGDCGDGKQLCAGACIPTSQPCMNMCAAGTHECNGQCLPDTSVNSCGGRCDSCPVPEHAAPTCDGATCDFKCATGYRRCGDICLGGSSCCAPADCPAVTNGTATCSANHLCGFTCAAGFHACNGRCVDDKSPASCGTSCTACPAPTGGTATCDGTSCGPSCPPGQKVCANACIPNGASCMGTCPAGTHDCAGLCLPDTSVNSCGSACTACPTVPNATPTCASGACGTQCNSGFKRCGDACIESSLCCADADCPGGACMGGRCCPTGQLNCGGACVDPTTNANHCGGCGKPCAGRCSAGVCCGANQTACGGVCYNTNSDAKHCGPGCAQCALGLLCVNGKCVL